MISLLPTKKALSIIPMLLIVLVPHLWSNRFLSKFLHRWNYGIQPCSHSTSLPWIFFSFLFSFTSQRIMSPIEEEVQPNRSFFFGEIGRFKLLLPYSLTLYILLISPKEQNIFPILPLNDKLGIPLLFKLIEGLVK